MLQAPGPPLLVTFPFGGLSHRIPSRSEGFEGLFEHSLLQWLEMLDSTDAAAPSIKANHVARGSVNLLIFNT